MSNRAVLTFCITLLLLNPPLTYAHDHEHEGHEHGADVVGKVAFPTSCNASVQSQFETGVALLHSFEYDRAATMFASVEKDDPDCAMAYWGSAMTSFHQIWSPPAPDEMAAGWAQIQKARNAHEQTAQEAAWINALYNFYQPGALKIEQRVTQYSLAMQKLYESDPKQDEPAIFYALSILADEPPGDTALLYPKKAVAILNQVLARNPTHPGVVHYLIHACDNPEMAGLGLAAARQYASIAASSPHAVHMPGHIFARLGLWKEDIASNLAAVAVSEQQHQPAFYALHPMEFLEYAYLQTGQTAKANAVVADAVGTPLEKYGHASYAGRLYDHYQAEFPAYFYLETRNWPAAKALTITSNGPGARLTLSWSRAIAAGHLHDVATAKAAVAEFNQAKLDYKKLFPDREEGPVDTHSDEVRAWLAYAQGDTKTAFRLMKEAADYQDKVGKAEVELPAREMLADMLFELKRPKPALEQYSLSLKSDPNRFNGLYGAGLSAEQTGSKNLAIYYYQQLMVNCDAGSAPERIELAHAQEFVKKNAAH